jgi:four helix bundle protein
MAGGAGGLIAWQRADDLFIKLHPLTFERFPPSERFELGSQLRRASYSVAANIAEGFADASLAETGYCLRRASSRLSERRHGQ